MIAVITGITSMLGLSTARACLNRGWKVIGILREGSNRKRAVPKWEGLTLLECNLDRMAFMNGESLPECDVFYHFAWAYTDRAGRSDPDLQQKNIEYTLDAVTLASRMGCKKFVGAGSQAEYGWHYGEKTTPETPTAPTMAYGICKLAAGKLARQRAAALGMDCFWVRIFSVYGTNDLPGTMISSTIEKLRKAEHCSFTAGTHLWDYLYAEDAGEAFALIGERAVGNKIYCLGSGEARPLREYIFILRDVVSPGAQLGMGEIPYPPQGGMSLCADISALTEDTGWMPKTDFRQGIEIITQG